MPKEKTDDSSSTVPINIPEKDQTITYDQKDQPSDAAPSNDVEHGTKETEDGNVLDKMESSMESKPSVFMYEDAAVASYN